ncbi:hypothetical protein D046_5100A, partial [Vibrio parahaemolyticus V-223/04]
MNNYFKIKLKKVDAFTSTLVFIHL